jgi:hypothetical protein
VSFSKKCVDPQRSAAILAPNLSYALVRESACFHAHNLIENTHTVVGISDSVEFHNPLENGGALTRFKSESTAPC